MIGITVKFDRIDKARMIAISLSLPPGNPN